MGMLNTRKYVLWKLIKPTVDTVLVSPVDLLAALWTWNDRLMQFLIELAISQIDLCNLGDQDIVCAAVLFGHDLPQGAIDECEFLDAVE